MSQLKDLIHNLCPDGVEYKPLSTIGKLTRGKRFVHADAVEDGIPCIHYGELYTYYGVWTQKTKSFVRSDLAKKLRYAKKNDVIIVGAGENNTDIGIAVAYLGDQEVAVHDACYIFRHNMNPKYISYCLRTDDYHNQIKKFVSSGKICAISAEGIGKASIPVPPREIQDRIVELLDRFSEDIELLIKELNSELVDRQRQFEYYRNLMFDFDSNVEIKPLWSVTTWDKRFQGVEKNKQPEINNYSVLLANELFSLKEDEGDVFLLSTGSETGWTTEERAGDKICEGEIVSIPWGKAGTVNVQNVIKYFKGKFVTGDNRIMTSNNTDVLDNHYLYYFITSRNGIDNTFYRGSGIRHPDMRKVLHIEIPVPDINVQRNMVKKLEDSEKCFLGLCDNLLSEIEMRKKQYAYYRDEILTFEQYK